MFSARLPRGPWSTLGSLPSSDKAWAERSSCGKPCYKAKSRSIPSIPARSLFRILTGMSSASYLRQIRYHESFLRHITRTVNPREDAQERNPFMTIIEFNDKLTRIVRGRTIQLVAQEEGLVKTVIHDYSTMRVSPGEQCGHSHSETVRGDDPGRDGSRDRHQHPGRIRRDAGCPEAHEEWRSHHHDRFGRG